MKTHITAWPIDKQFQLNLGIYNSGDVKTISVGRVLHELILAGYTELNSFVESTDHHNNPDKLGIRLTIHCAKPRENI